MALIESKRRNWSIEERQRIVDEALSPGASVAATARQHGVNANLVFKWIRRGQEGWLDRRRGPRSSALLLAPAATPGFVPVEIVAPTPALTTPAVPVSRAPRDRRSGGRRGAMEITLPNGARVSLDADVDAQALRRVLAALGDL